MTLIAGIVGRSTGWTPSPELCRAIAKSLSRHPREQLLEFHRLGAYFVKADIGAYHSPGTIEAPDGSLTLLAGDPLLATTDGCTDRLTATQQLHECVGKRDTALLTTATGVFSGARYDPGVRVLSLYTDKLGLRPIYYTITEDYIVFASALRVLEAMPHHAPQMDARGVTELIALGVPLGTRTPYTHIKVLDAAEVLRVGPSLVERSQYWSWSAVSVADACKPDELLDRAYDAFIGAVRRRIGSDCVTASYLSGGMDSRCVVAALRMLGVAVHTFTFAHRPNEDQHFAGQFAAEIGSLHTQVASDTGSPKWGIMMARAWEASEYGRPVRAEHPQLVWTGDGGSVSTGFVYLSDTIVAALRRDDVPGAIQAYLEQERASIPKKFLSREAARALNNLLEQEIEAELNRVRCDDRGRSFYFFLLLNDQRRHLAHHFEDIDLHRLEYQLPFFDSEFMAVVASVPLDWGLRHQFYTDWLTRFPAATTAVPWQTYPGHVPCPLPKPEGLEYQWNDAPHAEIRRARRFRTAGAALRIARAQKFPTSLFSRGNLAAAAFLHASGLRDYEYIVRAAETYHSYWLKAGGNHTLIAPHEK